jgi:hypothetical protein
MWGGVGVEWGGMKRNGAFEEIREGGIFDTEEEGRV